MSSMLLWNKEELLQETRCPLCMSGSYTTIFARAAQTWGVALTVPNFNRFDQVGGQWKGVLSYWDHLHYFRAEVLQLALEKRGCKVVELHTFTGAGQ